MTRTVRYFEATGDRLVLRASARDHLVRGALWLFAVPSMIALSGWSVYALVVETPSPLTLALTAGAIGLVCALSAVVGLFLMATATKRAGRNATHIDLGERLITLAGSAPDVFRTPDAIIVARKGLVGWTLRFAGEPRLTLIGRVPHGGGRDLAAAADALADALGVEAEVPSAARHAFGLIPHEDSTWAALCYAPLDGVNIAYSLLALMSSREPALRFAAKQSLALLAVELFLASVVSGCVGVPIAVASAPPALEAFAFLCPLLILGLIRMSVRLIASVKAYRGEVWVMPWLAPLARRWAPDE